LTAAQLAAHLATHPLFQARRARAVEAVTTSGTGAKRKAIRWWPGGVAVFNE
jgi:hypothetical protein